VPFADHFSRQSTQYAAYRPTYPRALGEFLAGVSPGRALVWDCGTGSGQAVPILAAAFDRVVATDASARQIANAEPHDRTEYRVAPASASGLDDASCDAVTVAQAAHWFDLPAFYAEARRVLRPRGVIALWCYGSAETDDAALNTCIQDFQYKRVEQYWPAGRELVEAGYATLPFPFERIAAPKFFVAARWRRDELIGYVSTWSAVARCREAEGVDPLPEFAAHVEAVWTDPSEARDVRWPMSLLVGRV
jgi:SAM-dependent methyltransferase